MSYSTTNRKIGIYKITNLINLHCYIGQSISIYDRWKEHQYTAYNTNDSCYNYPLYCAFRKYGLLNFSFEIIEECPKNKLNDREIYWINYYQPEYNQDYGLGYNKINGNKLSFEEVRTIQKILINDTEGKVSHHELAEQYHVHKDTIRDINVGRTWYDENLTYPLHYSKYDSSNPNNHLHYCIDCGKKISKTATRCPKCASKIVALKERRVERPSREELKNLIRTTPFTTIASQYEVTDNAIRKWCDSYNLPRKKSDIKQYSNEEWLKI